MKWEEDREYSVPNNRRVCLQQQGHIGTEVKSEWETKRGKNASANERKRGGAQSLSTIYAG